jgi:micrococcal nuclease
LHSVWDGAIINKEHITSQTILANYGKLSAAQIAGLKTENVANWINESRSSLPQIYSFSNSTLDESYVQKATPIIEEQILKAGIRLSGILEKALGNTTAPVPVQQTVQLKPGATFTAAEAKDHTGEKITVCDKVFGTRFLENSDGQPSFLNLGAAYPNSPFTIVIFGNDRANFKEKPELFYNNKKVCATGLIKEYNGKPEMILSNESEIKIAN